MNTVGSCNALGNTMGVLLVGATSTDGVVIGGVVVETGGVVAHAVMISREYGIPCVANLPRACDLIPDGALITVDGTNGRVIVHDEKKA